MKVGDKRKLALTICCGAHIVQDGLGAALYLLMPILAQAFGLNYSQIGILRATASCANAVFELPSGIISERFGERKLLVFGLVCAGLGYLLLATATSIWVIFISFVILGSGSAFQHALSSSIISHSFDDAKRRSALGIYNSSGDAGKLAFTGLFGLTMGIGLAWQTMVVVFASITLLFAGVLFVGLRRINVGSRQPAISGQGLHVDVTDWGIRDRAGFFNLCLSVFIDTAVQSAFLVFIVFVIAEKGVSTQLASFALVMTLIGGMFGKAICGYLAQHMGIRNSFALVQCLTAAGIIGLVMAPSLGAFLLLPILGTFLQGSTSITYGTISDLIRTNRQSRGFALIYSLSSFSAVVGPIAFGFISDHSGLDKAMLAMAFLSILAIVPIVFLKPAPLQKI